MNLRQCGKLALALILLLSSALLAAKPAQSSLQLQPGVDLIILIDQSGSMWGSAGRPATDPEDLRVDSARYLIDYMAFDNKFVNPHRTNRVVVIGFGSPDKTHIMVNLTSLDTEEGIASAKESIEAESLGNTNFISALRLVREVFPPASDEEVRSGLRRRVIVILTDGGPYDGRELSYGEYFTEIQDYYANELGADIYPLYTICVDEPGRYWSDVKAHWSTIAGEGHTRRVEDIKEARRVMVSLLCPLLNESGKSTECRLQDIGEHFMPPYVRSVSFSFLKYDPDAKISLYQPDGSEVTPNDQNVLEYVSGDYSELWMLDEPQAGCWHSERVGTGKVDVFIQVVFANLEMTRPDEPHPYILPLEFGFELKNTAGQPIDALLEYPITFEAQLMAPDGFVCPVDIRRTAAGEYVSTQAAETKMSGPYTLTVQGSTVLPPFDCRPTDGSLTIFTNTYQIPTYAPTLEVTEPVSPYLQYRPVPELTFGFLDRQGRLLSAPAVGQVELRLKSPSGGRMSLPAPVWDDGRYLVAGPLVLAETGVYQADVVVRDADGAAVYEGGALLAMAENVALISPGLNHPYFAPIRRVEVELRDLQDRPVAPDPDYPLRLEAEMNWPDGRTDTVDLTPTSETGRYKAQVDWTPTAEGVQRLTIVGWISLAPGDPEQVAFRAEREINVSANLPFFRLLSPSEEGSPRSYPLHYWYLPPYLPFSHRPMEVEVELRYGDKSTRAGDFFVGDVDQLFTVAVAGPSGLSVDERPLRDLTGQGTRFGVALPELTAPGTYTATVRLDGRVRGGVASRGAWPQVSVPFRREDSPAYLVVWWTITAIVALAAVCLLVWVVLDRLILPPLRGTLIAEPVAIGSTKELKKWSLAAKGRRHRLTLKGKDIPPSLQLKRIEIRRITRQRPGRRDEVEAGIAVRAEGPDGREVARGSMYAGSQQTLRVGRKTVEGENYRFRYKS